MIPLRPIPPLNMLLAFQVHPQSLPFALSVYFHVHGKEGGPLGQVKLSQNI